MVILLTEIKLVWLQLTFLKFMTKVTKQKRMEVGFVAGAVQNLGFVEKPVVGDVVIVLGGATGRDGVGCKQGKF